MPLDGLRLVALNIRSIAKCMIRSAIDRGVRNAHGAFSSPETFSGGALMSGVRLVKTILYKSGSSSADKARGAAPVPRHQRQTTLIGRCGALTCRHSLAAANSEDSPPAGCRLSLVELLGGVGLLSRGTDKYAYASRCRLQSWQYLVIRAVRISMSSGSI